MPDVPRSLVALTVPVRLDGPTTDRQLPKTTGALADTAFINEFDPTVIVDPSRATLAMLTDPPVRQDEATERQLPNLAKD